ncbi:transcriptional regulatory protein PhoP [Rhodoferax lithotrophicus]|uniref:Transcriptional regulatory protein PhoP n=1 Tax=Rhodoferax lithotrophicus TaxID=2798804 RepID=A0ABM7MJI7_9BURK|nr:response regulator transcription factor [Rhodoferax sp. MIZ03]BCO26445.1 transcriptional regulatory protein PhoP [Rhodoferax sp. MIZ03]
MATALNIIVVEDHDTLREVTVALLAEQGHKIIGLACAEALDDEAGGRVADIYLLDLNLPGENGISLARRIRHAQPNVGIIMVTARNLSQDIVSGYANGADIYLTKPLEHDELLAAVQALARRVKPGQTQASENSLTLDVQRLLLSGPKASIHVTDVDATLLSALVRAAGQRLAYWQLYEALGQQATEAHKASLEVRMVRLRKKITQATGDSAALKAVRGHGYQLCTNLQLK